MPIANESAVADARTTFEALAENALANSRSTGVWRFLAREVRPNGSVAHEFTLPGATPTWKQFLGERVREGFRKYSKRIPLKKYDKTLELDRASVIYDKDGSTGAALSQFMNDGESFWDKLVLDALATNPTGCDGVSIINDSHPYASGGGTWDNKTTSALSFSSYDTEVARMMNLTDENGEPLNLMPGVLLCNPADREIALQIAKSDGKPVSVATDGTINSGGVGGSVIANVFRGEIDVVISSRITSGDWLIIDPRYQPMAFCVWQEPQTVIVDDLTSSSAVNYDSFIYMMQADACADGLQPWGVAGKLT